MRSVPLRVAMIASPRLATALRATMLAAALVAVVVTEVAAEPTASATAVLGRPSSRVTSSPAGRPDPTPTPLAALDGPPDAPAGEYIPDLDVPEPSPEDVTRAAGVPIAVRDLIVIFRPTTTVAEANAVLRSLPAVIVGGTPDAQALLIRLTGPSDLGRVLAAQATLLANPLVAAASVNAASAPDGGNVR